MALVLEALPDEAQLARLEEQRGHGRDDYLVRPMWRATVAGIVLQHDESLIRDNPVLLELCGFSLLDYQDKPKVDDDDKPRTTSLEPRSTIPGSHNFCRFLSNLVESRGPWVDVMVRQLRERAELPDFGAHLGGKAVWTATRRGRSVARPGRLPPPTGGSTRRPAARPASSGGR